MLIISVRLVKNSRFKQLVWYWFFVFGAALSCGQ